MCFRNLPIDVDARNKAKLRPGTEEPYSYAQAPPSTVPEHGPKPMRDVRQVDFESVTRSSNETTVDLHELVHLVERGCPPETAVRIAAPLDWDPPRRE